MEPKLKPQDSWRARGRGWGVGGAKAGARGGGGGESGGWRDRVVVGWRERERAGGVW